MIVQCLHLSLINVAGSYQVSRQPSNSQLPQQSSAMFCGKISLLHISASQLPWSNENKTDQRSDLRPYLAISVDAEHRVNVGQEEMSQVSLGLLSISLFL